MYDYTNDADDAGFERSDEDATDIHIVATDSIYPQNGKGSDSSVTEPDQDDDDELDIFLPDLTIEEILALPGRERIPYVKAIRVYHDEWNTILEAMRTCHEENDGTDEDVECMMIVGPSGTGKTTLGKSYQAEFPPKYTEEGGKRRYLRKVLYIRVPAIASIKDTATEILYVLGDPRAHTGTRGNQTLRIRKALKDCGVELILMDDIQHFLDRNRTGRILYTATDWFKNLIKETGVACVFIGLPESEQVILANPQLSRLFGDPYELLPFDWEWDDPESIQRFRNLLMDIQVLLPLNDNERFSLSDIEMAWRCYVASGGLMAYLMKLIRYAAIHALKTGEECLSMELLAFSFTEKLAGKRRDVSNPFIGPAPERSASNKEKGRGRK